VTSASQADSAGSIPVTRSVVFPGQRHFGALSGVAATALDRNLTAVIQPAVGRELEILQRWDDFTLNVLTAEEERDLDHLDTDSWSGRFG
jgi:hypothetical protein